LASAEAEETPQRILFAEYNLGIILTSLNVFVTGKNSHLMLI